jgi:hypothetical protein
MKPPFAIAVISDVEPRLVQHRLKVLAAVSGCSSDLPTSYLRLSVFAGGEIINASGGFAAAL